VCGRRLVALALSLLGYPEQALQRSREALTLAQELSHPFSLAFVLSQTAMLHQFRREAQATRECAEAVMTLSTEQGFSRFLAMGTVLWGWVLTAQGHGEEGIAQIRQGLAAWQVTGQELGRPYFLALQAEAYGKVGKAAVGHTMLTEALALVDKTGEHQQEAELHRLQGELLLAQAGERQQVQEAEECFQQALTIAHHQQAKSWELRAAMSLSRLWQQQGKRAEARELLAPTYSWFTEGFDTPDLQEARALLEDLGI
jgi:predicted ATPase